MTTRRRPIAAVFALLLTLVLAACGSGSGDTGTTTANFNDSAASQFPVTLTHALGTVTIESTPARVVALGAGDVQTAQALGVNVVAAVRNTSSDDGNWPGTEPPLASNTMSLDSVDVDIEAIAAADPDVILATTAQQTYIDRYDQLSRIAPVVVYPTAPFAHSGDDLTREIGKALGKDTDAQALIDNAHRTTQSFASAHPDLDGSTFVFGQYAGGTLYLLASPDNPSTRFLNSLGLILAPEVADLADDGTQNGFVTVSPERFSLLSSADHVLISTPGDPDGNAFRSMPVVADLGDQLSVIPTDLAAALLTSNPGSTPYLIDSLDAVLG
jgi:iron complex transport system substrate-binding protein